MGLFQKYSAQVSLLLEIIPFIAKENCFALKGGSAINLFYQNLPRLSVDLDLVYLPLESREKAVAGINEVLFRLSKKFCEFGYSSIVQGSKDEKKIICSNQNATVKIEPNYTIRGTLLPPCIKSVSKKVQEQFGYAKMNVLDFPELYAGKICAALDRQHPRDLFDVRKLYEQNECISDDILNCFVVYLIGHNRPIHELLDCTMKDSKDAYEKEFLGMTDEKISYKELQETLSTLKSDLKQKLSVHKKFLLDFVRLEADFSLLPFVNAKDLPAVKWKMRNLEQLRQVDKEKFNLQHAKLAALL